MAKSEHVMVEVSGREVKVTSPNKVFFPEHGETKLDLVNYYVAVGEPLMRTMQGRPLLLERYPDGVGKNSFFQKRIPTGTPDWVTTTVVSTPNGTTSNALVAVDVAHVIWAVNLGCLGFHVWPYHADNSEYTDELRIDLDPQPGIVFDQVREAAFEVKRLFDELGIKAYLKTTGNRGLHVYVRTQLRWDSYDIRTAAIAAARELERRRPDLLTAAWWKEERGTRVFIDFNQNAPHKTVFGAWCARPRVGAQVSTPLSWDEVAGITPDQFTITNVPDRVAANGDPWLAMNDDPQTIEPLLALSERDAANGLLDAPWPPVYPKMPNEPPRVAPSRKKKDSA
ncbi:MAG: non-homologous end-joining DNA ligase [Acidimicrobiia bacterium]